MNDKQFRAGVGLIVANAKGQVLAIERSDNAGAWQLPQGGLEKNETPRAAAFRELEEETGLTDRDVELVAEFPVWLGYELPAEYRSPKIGRGQVHRWFLFRLMADQSAIHLPEAGEARAWRWTDFSDLEAETVEFRRGVYGQLKHWVLAALR